MKTQDDDAPCQLRVQAAASAYNHTQCSTCRNIFPTVDPTNHRYTDLCTGSYDFWQLIRPSNHLDMGNWFCNKCWCAFYARTRNQHGHDLFDARLARQCTNLDNAHGPTNRKGKRPHPYSSNNAIEAGFGTDSRSIIIHHLRAHSDLNTTTHATKLVELGQNDNIQLPGSSSSYPTIPTFTPPLCHIPPRHLVEGNTSYHYIKPPTNIWTRFHTCEAEQRPSSQTLSTLYELRYQSPHQWTPSGTYPHHHKLQPPCYFTRTNAPNPLVCKNDHNHTIHSPTTPNSDTDNEHHNPTTHNPNQLLTTDTLTTNHNATTTPTEIPPNNFWTSEVEPDWAISFRAGQKLTNTTTPTTTSTTTITLASTIQTRSTLETRIISGEGTPAHLGTGAYMHPDSITYNSDPPDTVRVDLAEHQ